MDARGARGASISFWAIFLALSNSSTKTSSDSIGHDYFTCDKTRYAFAEGNGDGRCFAETQRRVGHHDAGRGTHGQRVDGVVVRVRRARSCIARQVGQA